MKLARIEKTKYVYMSFINAYAKFQNFELAKQVNLYHMCTRNIFFSILIVCRSLLILSWGNIWIRLFLLLSRSLLLYMDLHFLWKINSKRTKFPQCTPYIVSHRKLLYIIYLYYLHPSHQLGLSCDTIMPFFSHTCDETSSTILMVIN